MAKRSKPATHLARQSLLKIAIFAAILMAFLGAERLHFQTSITEASTRLAHAAEIKGNILSGGRKAHHVRLCLCHFGR